MTFMRTEEREQGEERMMEDLTFKIGNWRKVENEDELTDSHHWDEKRKRSVWGCVCVGE